MSRFEQKEKLEQAEVKELIQKILPHFKGKSLKVSEEALDAVRNRIICYSNNSPIVFPDDDPE